MAQGSSPDEIWKPFGAFSQIVVGGDGQLVNLKGQVSLDKDRVIVGVADMSVQVNQVLSNILPPFNKSRPPRVLEFPLGL